MSNTLSIYRTVKRLGIPDSQIILMLADDIACNPRNVFPGSIFNNANRELDLYGENIEVDYRGYEVTVENFIRLLTNRWSPSHPASKKLLSDENSNILIYMAGHGGNEFLKFQDAEEISAFDIADSLAQMHEKRRYNEILFMIDTCQANTMYSKFYSPNILATGSSAIEESSYSHHADTDVGVAVIDRYTYHHLEFMEKYVRDGNSNATLAQQFAYVDFEKCHSTPGVRTDLFQRDLRDVKITDFFGGVSAVDLSFDQGMPFKASQSVHEHASHADPSSTKEFDVTGQFMGKVAGPEGEFQKKQYGPLAMLVTFLGLYIGVKQL
ncbi:GPI-anchor transamidase [Taphrina deformans PYCC 5710]|uniref:GPI-anchor transamidase n=1 Tax=Taphrina deformans (strain PYCC 5710 / ATCC 11124 / CBS 356.35 / IMI 108563 / JCM 9778 / NBRC 8474) TaxID=1097556 RepID=R4XB67_TAPDE|nr:GPI-anchor transamidase [Taphrina deformans PYCC 5710]|eukprot:CCG83068.1 GPI-anchor transamidase [Taphrina deformans PYCC 5710]